MKVMMTLEELLRNIAYQLRDQDLQVVREAFPKIMEKLRTGLTTMPPDDLFRWQMKILQDRGCPSGYLKELWTSFAFVLSEANKRQFDEGSIPFMLIPQGGADLTDMLIRHNGRYTRLAELRHTIKPSGSPCVIFDVSFKMDTDNKTPDRAKSLLRAENRFGLNPIQGIVSCALTDMPCESGVIFAGEYEGNGSMMLGINKEGELCCRWGSAWLCDKFIVPSYKEKILLPCA